MKDIVLVSLQKMKTQNVLVKFLEKKKDVFVNYMSNKKMVRYTSKDGGWTVNSALQSWLGSIPRRTTNLAPLAKRHTRQIQNLLQKWM